MAGFLDKFKNIAKKGKEKIKEAAYEPGAVDENDFPELDEEGNEIIERESFDGDYYNEEKYDVGIQPSQKPESFHHYILQNEYKDLERSIRGFKDVLNKETQQWETIRKKEHCFTDEEAEEILRTAQSHLATDVKLGYISKEAFPLMMDALYKELAFLFESIAEYRYGRYNKFNKNGVLLEENYEKQYKMKLQNHKIFLELFTRVQANYSRAIQGQENKLTHQSVKGQESLQNTEPDYSKQRGYT